MPDGIQIINHKSLPSSLCLHPSSFYPSFFLCPAQQDTVVLWQFRNEKPVRRSEPGGAEGGGILVAVLFFYLAVWQCLFEFFDSRLSDIGDLKV